MNLPRQITLCVRAYDVVVARRSTLHARIGALENPALKTDDSTQRYDSIRHWSDEYRMRRTGMKYRTT